MALHGEVDNLKFNLDFFGVLVFCERRSRESVSYEEQILSKDKYPSMFSPQMASIVFIILQIFFATRAVLKIGEHLTTIHRSGGG